MNLRVSSEITWEPLVYFNPTFFPLITDAYLNNYAEYKKKTSMSKQYLESLEIVPSLSVYAARVVFLKRIHFIF